MGAVILIGLTALLVVAAIVVLAAFAGSGEL